MSRTLRIVVLFVLALVTIQTAVAEEPNPAKGARALFGQGNEEIFFPRQSGAGSTANMDPTNQVNEEMLTSFYKKPDFPGLAYSLELIRAGESTVRTVEDARTHEFHTGDRMRIRLVPNFTGYAYVMEAKSGSSKLVYPANFGTAENQVTAGRETYVPNLRTGELASVISSAGRPVIVEGVCLLAALEAVSIEADVLIYVKRVGAHGYWDDQDTCDPEEDEEALISRLSQETAAFAKLISPQLAEESAAEEGVGLAPLREEIIRYHCKHRPSRKAQIALLSAA